ncbi:MAG: hypothetical protein CVU06_03935 [Bacteroidetes bacterium HGW-Bacteroidetes-22]|nr:MAG: hypothetical protein CVU06_03935 [Bacteroidetes bacterium HGW-Bacteroidetes-22]
MKRFAFFMAHRLASGTSKGVSSVIIRLAIISVALGISVMMISISILGGFRHEIQEKITAYTGHIRISGYTSNASFEATPISVNQKFYPWNDQLPPIRHIQQFATKAGIIKTNDQIMGVVFKGVTTDFDSSFFHKKLISGHCPRTYDSATSNEVMISEAIARNLGFKTGDPMRIWFITGNELIPRGRKLTICGIYDTGLEEFDQLYLLGDLRHLKRLNNWDEDQTGGFEIFLNDFSQIDDYGNRLYEVTNYDLDVKTIKQLYPQIFDWLDLQNINVAVILGLMVFVAAIALVSVLLVLILEQTNFIGILKAMGASSRKIRQIFLIQAARIALTGMIWGNTIAAVLIGVQMNWKIIRLPQEAYYVSYVPVLVNWPQMILLNIGALIICVIILTLPALLIERISPVKAIRFS